MARKGDVSRGAVLQLEIDLGRWAETRCFSESGYGDTPHKRLYAIAKTAVCDTIHQGGTFVLVADQSAGTVTMVQRPDAEEITG